MCAAAVFIATRDEDEPKPVVLSGRTERGHPIELVLDDGKLHSFATGASALCPEREVWHSWEWHPSDGNPVRFRQDGRRIYVRERAEFPDAEPPAVLANAMRAELAKDGDSIRGTIAARGIWGVGHDSVFCAGRVSFGAG